MELFRPSKLLPYAIFVGLGTVFAREVIFSFMKWRDDKVAISVEEMKSKYVKFPSICVCLDVDEEKEEIGFKTTPPLNESLSFVKFVRHFRNG